MPGQSTQKTANQQADLSSAHDSKICKVFNMCMYKIHALGHYVAAIAWFGMTDSYSTQVVNHTSFLSWFLLIFCFRESLNISESNDFMHKQIKEKVVASDCKAAMARTPFEMNPGAVEGERGVTGQYCSTWLRDTALSCTQCLVGRFWSPTKNIARGSLPYFKHDAAQRQYLSMGRFWWGCKG